VAGLTVLKLGRDHASWSPRWWCFLGPVSFERLVSPDEFSSGTDPEISFNRALGIVAKALPTLNQGQESPTLVFKVLFQIKGHRNLRFCLTQRLFGRHAITHTDERRSLYLPAIWSQAYALWASRVWSQLTTLDAIRLTCIQSECLDASLKLAAPHRGLVVALRGGDRDREIDHFPYFQEKLVGQHGFHQQLEVMALGAGVFQ
jgi:hypothetical protein